MSQTPLVSQTTTQKRTVEKSTLAVGGLAAILASTCCLGPLMLVMPKLLAASALALAALIAIPAWSATQTITLAVSRMTCAACPITVKRALSRVPGVSEVRVSFEKKEATVVFDDTRTTVAALTRATMDAGYPSRVEQEKAAGK